MSKCKENCKIYSQEEISPDIFSMWLEAPAIAEEARAGQFVSVYCRDGSRLLPRPISLCEIDRENGRLRLVYRIAGKGTQEFSKLHKGVSLPVLGPLGNGFPLEEAKGKRVLLLGGGIGIPPMLETAKALKAQAEAMGEKSQVTMAAGYRDVLFLHEDFQPYCDLAVATENGSQGTRGNVLDAIREQGLEADVIMACGPTPMLRAVKAYALEKKIPCWISMEERMACGVGACLGCVCQSRDVDAHSHVHNKRVCKDGPVFLSTEVELG
ncbi:MAG TPA: dihydroorotate dehydrogenase electron transfer subunit [Candidatus Blautia gallistercoris]|uniref:Dihydroorotate dehydrogenase B (NAD(+)), electron transfer subunit n=1 Tax=Candidatus Blautia gallistercoris TaxID=2838490 RepID=A0A9D1WHQ0_9FIRM|nr:dihydroorotate dehydrogenase electron transfer subunit [Candidatus Blautia gallistercoris]